MEAQATDIASTRKADWVVGSLFGGAAAASVRELHRGGFPANRFLSFVYGAVEADVEAAGWDVAQGYLGLQFTALGRDSTVQDIVKMFRDDGKKVPKYVGGAYYNRGVLTGALLVEGVRIAIRDFGRPRLSPLRFPFNAMRAA
jgi:branched-chain amino acid transport system substrate-binding protein